MGHARKKPAGAASPLRTLMIAWVIVVGLAFAPAATYVRMTNDYPLAIAAAGAALLVGGALFVAMGLARAGTRQHSRVEDDGHIADLTRRGAVFGRR